VNEQFEAAKLLQEFPALKRFSNRLRLIERLKADAAEETDMEMMKNSYEIILRMQERLYSDIITYISEEHSKQFQELLEICKERMKTIDMLIDMLKKAYGLNEIDIAISLKAKRKVYLKLIKK